MSDNNCLVRAGDLPESQTGIKTRENGKNTMGKQNGKNDLFTQI